MCSGLPCRIDASSIAASRLLAAPIAWMSPVKCRLRSSIGTTCVMPPPAAPPLMPKTGPSEGSRRQATGRLPMTPRPCVRPTSVVVLPSPALVGVMPVTHTSLPLGASLHAVEHAEVDLRLVAPVGLELLVLQADFLGDLLDRLEDRVLCDLEAALHGDSMIG